LDSQTIIWLDKDNLFPEVSQASDIDYYILEPTQKEFTDTCNEFWWVSTYVAKGLARAQIIYAKDTMDTVVRPMLMKMVEWKIGSENNFAIATGKAGKFMQQYLSPEDYQRVLSTYADHQTVNNWKALTAMTQLFSDYANTLSAKLDLIYNTEEEKNTLQYLEAIRLKN